MHIFHQKNIIKIPKKSKKKKNGLRVHETNTKIHKEIKKEIRANTEAWGEKEQKHFTNILNFQTATKKEKKKQKTRHHRHRRCH